METKTMSFRDTIILAMSEEMRRDENVFLMGEDVGVFGGDFGTSVGMLQKSDSHGHVLDQILQAFQQKFRSLLRRHRRLLPSRTHFHRDAFPQT